MWQSCDGGFNAWCFAVIPVSLWLACIMAVRFCVGRWQQCCSIMILWAGDLWMDLSSVFFIGNIMNLERIPNEEKLSLCRRYYLGMLWQWDIMTGCDVFSVILYTCHCFHCADLFLRWLCFSPLPLVGERSVVFQRSVFKTDLHRATPNKIMWVCDGTRVMTQCFTRLVLYHIVVGDILPCSSSHSLV